VSCTTLRPVSSATPPKVSLINCWKPGYTCGAIAINRSEDLRCRNSQPFTRAIIRSSRIQFGRGISVFLMSSQNRDCNRDTRVRQTLLSVGIAAWLRHHDSGRRGLYNDPGWLCGSLFRAGVLAPASWR
jgi:hypothetical protein